MLNPDEISEAINRNDPSALAALIKKHNLSLNENKIIADPSYVAQSAIYWDRMQLIKKILLNS